MLHKMGSLSSDYYFIYGEIISVEWFLANKKWASNMEEQFDFID